MGKGIGRTFASESAIVTPEDAAHVLRCGRATPGRAHVPEQGCQGGPGRAAQEETNIRTTKVST